MALIKCPECGKEVSDTIKSCIHCGFELNKESDKTPAEKLEEPVKEEDKTWFCAQEDKEDNLDKATSSISKILFIVFCAVVLFLFFMFALIFSGSSSPPENETTTVEATYDETVAIKNDVELIGIFADYIENGITAEEKYNEKRLEISCPGTVTFISKDVVEIKYDGVLVNNSEAEVRATFGSSQIEFLKTIKKDDEIKVTGTFNGFSGIGNIIRLENCTFEAVED